MPFQSVARPSSPRDARRRSELVLETHPALSPSGERETTTRALGGGVPPTTFLCRWAEQDEDAGRQRAAAMSDARCQALMSLKLTWYRKNETFGTTARALRIRGSSSGATITPWTLWPSAANSP